MTTEPEASRRDTISLLDLLLEAERAGVVAVADLEASAPADAAIAGVLAALARDEGRYAAGLKDLVRDLGGDPSPRTGDFAEKVRALPTFAEKLALLDRGQRWVMKRIREALPKITDTQVISFLTEMDETHERNVRACARVLSTISTGRST